MPIHNGEIHVRGTNLAVRDNLFSLGVDHAAKPAFVWGHCLLGSMAQDDTAALLDWRTMEEKIRLVRYDVRGHGESTPCPNKQAFYFDELTEDLIAVTERSGLRRFALGGVSLGSALALHVATSFPQRVSALVLMAPPTAWAGRARQSARYRNISRGIRLGGLAPLQLLSVLSRFQNKIPTEASAASVLARSTVENAIGLDRRSVSAAFLGAAASDLPSEDSLRKLTQPTLIISWRNDSSHPASTAQRLASLIPNSELHFHSSLIDIRKCTGQILTFLSKNRVNV